MFLSLSGLRAADVTGKWTATFNTEIGEQSYTYDFVVKGTVLTGTAKGNLTGESKISDGKVEGDKISFVENVDFQGDAVADRVHRTDDVGRRDQDDAQCRGHRDGATRRQAREVAIGQVSSNSGNS